MSLHLSWKSNHWRLFTLAGQLAVLALLLTALCPAPPPASARPSQQTTGLADLPAAAQSAISSAIGRDQSDYRISATTNGYRAVNPAYRLAVEFDAMGARIEAGNESGWNLQLRGLGRGAGALGYAGSGDVLGLDVNGNRVEYRFAGFTEWYVNGPLGLEQGFTLAALPPVSMEEGAVTFAVDLGEHTAKLDEGGMGVTLVGEDGRDWLRYSGLSALDAAGKELPAWMEIEGDSGMDGEQSSSSLLVRVNDTGAQYPITIDPWIQAAKLTASDGATFDSFGASVAINGDTIVVGAPYHTVGTKDDHGAAYVFVKPAVGWSTATQTAVLTASDGAVDDRFGNSVAINGDIIVVGAYLDDIGTNMDQGSAYVFVKPGGGWAGATQTAKLTASDGVANDWFGSAVAISGDTIVVGTSVVTIGNNVEQGAAYVFVKPPGGEWVDATQTAKLVASDGAQEDRFGYSVAISGDTIVAGAYGDDIGSNMDQGSVYVFVKPVGGWSGSPTQKAKLTASDGMASDYLGSAVAMDGDTIVAGAYDRAFGAKYAQGVVYVFAKPLSGWATGMETAELTASDGEAGDQFGYSVAISGDTIVVGAPYHWTDTTPRINGGAAYVFVAPGGGWADATETRKHTASDSSTNALFGYSVGISGETILVAAAYSTVGTNTAQGSAYVFTKAPTTTSVAASVNPTTYGQSVTFTATVSSGAGGTPTGSVAFKDGTTLLGTVALSGSFATFTTSALRVGAHTITADYAGDSGSLPSSGGLSIAFTVNKADTMTALSSVTPEPSLVGQAVTLSFAVTAGVSGTPAGNVTVSDNASAATCTAPVAAGRCAITFSTKGTHMLTATFGGDVDFNGSVSAPVSHTVNSPSAPSYLLYLPVLVR